MEKVNITEVEAQRRIQQINQTAQQRAQEEVRQEAQTYVGNLINFAEVQHQSQMAAAKEQTAAAKAAAKAADKAANAAKAAKEKAEKSEHDTEHKSQRSPNTRAKAKQKADDTPLNQVPPFPTSEQATGSQERPRYNVHPNDNVNPESTHEPKGPKGRPSNTQPKPKAKSRGPNIRVDTKTRQEPPPPNNNPAHDTEKDENKKPSYWNKKGLGYLKDQLDKRGFRTTHKPNGKPLRRPDYLEEVLRLIAAGRW